MGPGHRRHPCRRPRSPAQLALACRYTRGVTPGLVVVFGAVLAVAVWPSAVRAQQPTRPEPAQPRAGAVTLQDLPRVRIDDADGASHDRVPDPGKAGRPAPGAFTFLSGTPGSYRRVARITDRVSYVQHLENGQRYVSFRGGLRIALGK